MVAPVKMDQASYCRELETHLCRKNGGHLIRIAGPSFSQVCGWATRGVPLKIAFRGMLSVITRGEVVVAQFALNFVKRTYLRHSMLGVVQSEFLEVPLRKKQGVMISSLQVSAKS